MSISNDSNMPSMDATADGDPQQVNQYFSQLDAAVMSLSLPAAEIQRRRQLIQALKVKTAGSIYGGGCDGRTPLDLTANRDITEEEARDEYAKDVISFLMDRGGFHIDSRNAFGQTALHEATKNEYLEGISALLDQGADTTVNDDKGNIPVHYALEKRNLEMARLFFEHETKTRNTDGLTLLHIACRFGITKAALPLLREEGAMDAETCDGTTPLHMASEFGHSQLVRVLLNQRANAESKDKEGRTSLHWACGSGHVEVAENLLEQGADIEAKERHGWTPLQLASQNDQLSTVQLLVDRGANIHASGTDEGTPLHIACRFGCLKVATFLLDAGANVKEKTVKGRTALHVASKYGQLEMVRLLLKRGGHDWPCQRGKSPEQLARKYGHTKIEELLASCSYTYY